MPTRFERTIGQGAKPARVDCCLARRCRRDRHSATSPPASSRSPPAATPTSSAPTTWSSRSSSFRRGDRLKVPIFVRDGRIALSTTFRLAAQGGVQTLWSSDGIEGGTGDLPQLLQEHPAIPDPGAVCESRKASNPTRGHRPLGQVQLISPQRPPPLSDCAKPLALGHPLLPGTAL